VPPRGALLADDERPAAGRFGDGPLPVVPLAAAPLAGERVAAVDAELERDEDFALPWAGAPAARFAGAAALDDRLPFAGAFAAVFAVFTAFVAGADRVAAGLAGAVVAFAPLAALAAGRVAVPPAFVGAAPPPFAATGAFATGTFVAGAFAVVAFVALGAFAALPPLVAPACFAAGAALPAGRPGEPPAAGRLVDVPAGAAAAGSLGSAASGVGTDGANASAEGFGGGSGFFRGRPLFRADRASASILSNSAWASAISSACERRRSRSAFSFSAW